MRVDEDIREKGGIEGLPLQLMIVILVATMGTAVIMGWMGSIETPHAIGALEYTGTISAGDGGALDPVDITVFDQDGDLLEGATVILSGMNVKSADGGTAWSTTGPDGRASFEGLRISHAGDSKCGFIDILVTKEGYTDSSRYKITVVL